MLFICANKVDSSKAFDFKDLSFSLILRSAWGLLAMAFSMVLDIGNV